MEWRVEPPEAGEELSFGDGDPERESRLQAWEAAGRRWASAHRRLLAVGAAVVVLLGLLGSGGWYLYQESRKPLPPPDAALPVQDRFTVSLCQGRFFRCPSGTRGAEAAKDTRRLEERLRAIPGVVSLRFVSREARYQRMSDKTYIDPDGRTGRITLDMMQDTFEGVLRDPALFGQVAEQARRIAGVERADRLPTDFWQGRADVTVTLCRNDPARVCAPLKHRPLTEEEKQAILDRIREVRGVEKVYFEDQSHALRLERHYYPEGSPYEGPILLGDMNESYHVKIAGPDAARRVREALKGVTGVQLVW
ncbi:permease-like cell division protein FtsX [Sphaerisporangium dianthi]|uniref:Permease-like cell division protein FtsX n=1 Tax=Sphaerisporangium dianthi TaxID=1436120 RepID=A0ABV9CEZ0_9ACTN